jgi:hypothetical protein
VARRSKQADSGAVKLPLPVLLAAASLPLLVAVVAAPALNDFMEREGYRAAVRAKNAAWQARNPPDHSGLQTPAPDVDALALAVACEARHGVVDEQRCSEALAWYIGRGQTRQGAASPAARQDMLDGLRAALAGG